LRIPPPPIRSQISFTTLVRCQRFVIWLYQPDSEICNSVSIKACQSPRDFVQFASLRRIFHPVSTRCTSRQRLCPGTKLYLFRILAGFSCSRTSCLLSRDISQFPVYAARGRCFFPVSKVKQTVHMKYRYVVKHFRSSSIDDRSDSLRWPDFADNDIHYVRLVDNMLRFEQHFVSTTKWLDKWHATTFLFEFYCIFTAWRQQLPFMQALHHDII